jgi:hypothetical protein
MEGISGFDTNDHDASEWKANHVRFRDFHGNGLARIEIKSIVAFSNRIVEEIKPSMFFNLVDARFRHAVGETN